MKEEEPKKKYKPPNYSEIAERVARDREERKKASSHPPIVGILGVVLAFSTPYFVLLLISKLFLPEDRAIVGDPDPLYLIVPSILAIWFLLAKRGLTGGGEVKGPLDFISIVVIFLTFVLFIIGSLFILSDGGSFLR